MGLLAGTRLGSYEVTAALGAGGMGEVYRARDTKLGREVAIKLLPSTWSQDPERVARFEREAQALAALNHPSIAAIYGLEEASASAVDGGKTVRFLVLELVEGETLADRLARPNVGRALSGPPKTPDPRGSGLQIDEVLSIARQIADALQAAHDKGIIHRDLKPANIALRSDGQVKVLDFGLAKFQTSDGGDSGSAGLAEVTNSPTLTLAPTMAGVILGTAAYMSPEQAKGRAADKRTDVWAFGCVLYEMITGKRAFDGEDATDIIAAVVRAEPDWNALPGDTPSAIRTLLKGCLEKDRRERIADISTALFILKQPAVLEPTGSASGTGPAPDSPAKAGHYVLPWIVAGTLAASLAVIVTLWAPWKKVSPPVPLRLSAELGTDVSLPTNQGPAAALSPDGNVLTFAAGKTSGGDRQLHVRRLDELKAAAFPGTDGAYAPFFSPDGQWIAFFAGGKLKKIAVRGGAAVTLCDAQNGRGGSWADDGTIVFQPSNGADAALWRVSSAGGKPEPLTTLGGGEVTERWPQVLPGGKAVLYTGHTTTTNWDDARITVQALPKGPPKILVPGGYFGRYLPSGHIVYIHEGTLFAVPFDLNRLELAGQPVPALEGVSSNPAGGLSGSAQFAAATNGTLVYLPGQSVGSDAPISWMDQAGATMPLRATPSNWSNPSFSPDGRRLAVDISDGKQLDVWVYEWTRDTLTRLTFDSTNAFRPVWTPDSKRIVFSSSRNKPVPNLYWLKADGTDEVQRLTESSNGQIAASWHPSGKLLAFFEIRGQSNRDLMILPMEGDEATGWKPGKPTVFLSGPFDETEPMFSPDGRWLAYLSDESGRTEVYVRPFPGPGGRWQISTGGGVLPTWSPKKPELFFGYPTDQRMMVASYTVDGDSFRADKPRRWSDLQLQARPRQRSAAIHPDGLRFAVSAARPATTGAKDDKLVFIFNFFDELKRLAPPAK